MTEIPILQCPLDCIASFGEVFNGQYDCNGVDGVLCQNAVYNPIILDIGANVGAFSIWASERWTRSKIYAYEPQPDIYPFLMKNLVHQNHRVFPIKAAVSIASGGAGEKAYLFPGANRLRSSVYSKLEEKEKPAILIDSIHPKELRHANIIKLDCEGSEGYICEHLQFIPEYLVLEYHSEDLMRRCLEAMKGKMTLVESSVTSPGIGMLKFLRL